MGQTESQPYIYEQQPQHPSDSDNSFLSVRNVAEEEYNYSVNQTETSYGPRTGASHKKGHSKTYNTNLHHHHGKSHGANVDRHILHRGDSHRDSGPNRSQQAPREAVDTRHYHQNWLHYKGVPHISRHGNSHTFVRPKRYAGDISSTFQNAQGHICGKAAKMNEMKAMLKREQNKRAFLIASASHNEIVQNRHKVQIYTNGMIPVTQEEKKKARAAAQATKLWKIGS